MRAARAKHNVSVNAKEDEDDDLVGSSTGGRIYTWQKMLRKYTDQVRYHTIQPTNSRLTHRCPQIKAYQSIKFSVLLTSIRSLIGYNPLFNTKSDTSIHPVSTGVYFVLS